jgi:hypothetical protein
MSTASGPTSLMRPLCFVAMPFGTKPDGNGRSIEFDAVYTQILKPAIEAAGLEPLRADEEQAGGIIHKPMYERLILCRYAVVDLTTANANVFYELGLRHAVRPHSTVLCFAQGMRLPFDVTGLRGVPYRLGDDGKPSAPAGCAELLATLLRTAKADVFTDSPLYQLIKEYPQVDERSTEVFRSQVEFAQQAKHRVAIARALGADALRAEQLGLGMLNDVDASVLIELFLAYRDVKAWPDMIALAAVMPKVLASAVMVREQLSLALNRVGQGNAAEQVLLALIAERGPSSETCGILGRVYKDRWEAAAKAGDAFAARGLLDKAITVYLQGFEADSRDFYPGINAVTLMVLKQPPDARAEGLIPVVRFAVEQRLKGSQPGYWDHATRLELAVLGVDQAAAEQAAGDALATLPAGWAAETTARNLRLIREARAARGQNLHWDEEIERAFVVRS